MTLPALVFWALVVLVAYKQAKNWVNWQKFRIWARSQGCLEPAIVPNYLPGGLERYIRFFMYAKGADILEDFVVARFEGMKSYTYRVFNPFNSSMINTAEPANIQAILASKFHDFDLGPNRHKGFHAMFGDGIFTADGDAWSHFRHQLRPQFARDQISDLNSANRHLNVLFRALPEQDKDGWVEEADLMPLFYRFTMDVSTEFLFGESVDTQIRTLHSLDSTNYTEAQNDVDFVTALEAGQAYISWRYRMGSLFWLFNSKEFQKQCKTVKSFVDSYVQTALVKAQEKKTDNKFVFLDELVKETQDRTELRDQVLHLLLAGRDTTSALLSWTILLLARHPSEYCSLRKTVIDTFGTIKHPRQEPTFESLKACKQLTHTLFETLRLYPLIPINARRALKDTILPVGGGADGKSPMSVKKDEQVGYSAYVLHRRKDLWGDDAMSWRPGRWEGRKLGWDFVGFSGGPRICLGQQYALTEASFVVVRILQRYDAIEALDMTGKIKKGLSFTLKPGDGVKVKMHRAAD